MQLDRRVPTVDPFLPLAGGGLILNIHQLLITSTHDQIRLRHEDLPLTERQGQFFLNQTDCGKPLHQLGPGTTDEAPHESLHQCRLFIGKGEGGRFILPIHLVDEGETHLGTCRGGNLIPIHRSSISLHRGNRPERVMEESPHIQFTMDRPGYEASPVILVAPIPRTRTGPVRRRARSIPEQDAISGSHGITSTAHT